MCLQFHSTLTNPSYPVLITGGYDRKIRVWNMDTGQVVRTLEGHTRGVRALQFDQMLLFTGSMDGTVRMWNWRAAECLRVLEAHTDGVISLNYNGYLLATGSADTSIHVWNFRTGNHFSLPGHDEWVSSVVLWDGKTSPGDYDPTRMPSFTRHRNNASPDPSATDTAKPKEPEFDPGAMLFSAGDDHKIKLWDLSTKECIRVFDGHKAPVQSIKIIMSDMTANDFAAAQRRKVVRRAITPPGVNGNSQNGTAGTASHFTTASQALLTPSPPHEDIELPDGFDPASTRDEANVSPRVYVHPGPDERKRAKKDGDAEIVGKRAILASGSLDGTVKLWSVDDPDENSTLFG